MKKLATLRSVQGAISDQDDWNFLSDRWTVRVNVIEDCFDTVSFNFANIDDIWKNSIKRYVFGRLRPGSPSPVPNALFIRGRFYAVCRFYEFCRASFLSSPSEVDIGLIREHMEKFCDAHSGRPNSKKYVFTQLRAIREFFEVIRPGDDLLLQCDVLTRLLRKRHKKLDYLQADELPEKYVLSIIAEAIEVIEQDASKVIGLRDKFREYLVASDRRGRKVSAAAASNIASEAKKVELRSRCLQLDLSRPTQLGRAIKIVEGAAITVLAFLCAQRISELRRSSVVNIITSCTDGETHGVLHGMLSKKARSHEWVMAPAAVVAFGVIRSITDPFRAKNGQTALFFTGQGARVWGSNWDDTANLSVSSKTALANRMCLFIDSTMASEEFDVGRRVQFRDARRFLARFVARRDKTSLGSLARQYGHLDVKITDTYYVRNDKELGVIIGEEASTEVFNALSDLANSGNVYSGGDQVELSELKWRMNKILSRSATKLDVMKMLGGGTILGPCDWGYCIYRKETSKCEGGEFAPSDARRTPDICATCTNFAATHRHLNWWSNRAEDLRLFLKLKNIPEQAKGIASTRLKNAEIVVKTLSGEGARE
ncbi:hypothetical protein [Xanthomonas arboricola]|uniref:hypothetical protein n=1 Tax=Xanthomonas arboricola TaxID=56448 RepID=UPI0011B09515|nr:hypothetical protein [Xanthomonas arboricola]